MKAAIKLVLGSAAAIIATAAAQATDFPGNAKPVDYVKTCPQYGGGFSYVPGTNTCTMDAMGQQAFGHTWQFGGGFSAGLSAATGATSAARNVDGKPRAGDSTPVGLGAWTIDNGNYGLPDIVANLRVDQSWGSAMLKAALHRNRSGHDASFPAAAAASCAGGAANSAQCGPTDDRFGWAFGAGVALNISGLPGSSISLETHYGQGPTDYASRSNQSWRLWGDGRSVGSGWVSDNMFGGSTDLDLTRSWGFVATAEHRWNPQWRSSVYGGYERIDYSKRAEDMICSRGAFAGSPSALVSLATANCSPDLGWWNIGTRAQWNPHPLLDIGLDVAYQRLTTAQRGAGAIEDQDHLRALFRIQYNLSP
jgi:Porin subfamily